MQQMVQPLLKRIESLEKNNEELRLQVRHLELLVGQDKSYQKTTCKTGVM